MQNVYSNKQNKFQNEVEYEASKLQYTKEFNTENFGSIITNIIQHPYMKAVVAAISVFGEWMFGAHVEALLVVFILLILDTVTGMIVACKKGGLSSAGFFRFAAKLSIYMILMATSSLLDKLLPVNAGSAIMYTFLGVTEAISIMENISILGFPVPIKLVRMLRVMSDTEFKKMKLTKKSSGDNKK